MLTDHEIGAIVQRELDAALSYEGEIAERRARLMDAYNAQPYGDEIEGQSQVVTTDVADVVEGMLPNLVGMFCQGKTVAHFDPVGVEDEEEAEEKTLLSNHLFMEANDGIRILHDAFKDALIQYTGTVKVYWDEAKDVKTTAYQNLEASEYQKLLLTPGARCEGVTQNEDGTYNCEKVEITTVKGIQYDNIPPEEFLVSKNARDFNRPRFLGHRSPKTRSELISMGFDRELVDTLPADEYYEDSEQKNARYHDYDTWQEGNVGGHTPNDIVYLTEAYVEIDVDGDGVTEYWQVHYAGTQVLDKAKVDDHPFAVMVPIPIPHRAIGTCPAEQAADIQYRKTALERQLLNNIYNTNFPRFGHSNKVDLDDLLTPRSGGAIGVDTDAPDVAGHVSQIMTTPLVEPILAALEYTDNAREVRTGVTKYNQGLDSEALNKTATGFMGIRDMSQQRMYLIAKLMSEGVREIFSKTVDLLAKYQDGVMVVRDSRSLREIDPARWGGNSRCRIDVGIGSGDRQEKIMNLNAVIQRQLDFFDRQMPLASGDKIFHALDKLCTEVGLKEASPYFNDPAQPQELLQAHNEQLSRMVMQLQQQIQQNPLAEAEMIKAQARLVEAQSKGENEMRKFVMEYAQDNEQFAATLAKELTELELKYAADVPGSQV